MSSSMCCDLLSVRVSNLSIASCDIRTDSGTFLSVAGRPAFGRYPPLFFFSITKLFKIHITLCFQLLDAATDIPTTIDEVYFAIDAVVYNLVADCYHLLAE